MKFGGFWSKQVHTPEALAAIEDRHDLTDPEQNIIWRRQYLCDWRAGILEGRPYQNKLLSLPEEHFQDFKINPTLPLNFAFDDGRAVTAVWGFQQVGNKIMLLFYREWKDTSLPEVAKSLSKLLQELGLQPGVFVLPHTMRERSYSLATKLSRVELLKLLFKGRGRFIVLPRVEQLEHKFAAGRSVLPRCYFNPETAKLGIERLTNYQLVQIKANTLSPVFSNNVKKDQNSHGGDSFGELAIASASGRLEAALSKLSIQTNPLIDKRFLPRSILYPY